MYDELTARRAAKQGSRDGSQSNTHPLTRRTYVLRSLIVHECGRRMCGTRRHGATYYICRPSNNDRGRPDRHVGHEKAAYIREDAILEAVSAFYGDRVFGAHRRDLFRAVLATVDDRETRLRDAERTRLQCALADLARRQNNVMRQAQDSDPDDPFTQGLRQTYNQLEAERRATHAALAGLDAVAQQTPAGPAVENAELLDLLPNLSVNLTNAPEQLLRSLFEVTRLTVRLHPDSNDVTLTIRLPADDLPHIAEAAAKFAETGPSTQETPGQTADSSCEDVVCAPGPVRGHTITAESARADHGIGSSRPSACRVRRQPQSCSWRRERGANCGNSVIVARRWVGVPHHQSCGMVQSAGLDPTV